MTTIAVFETDLVGDDPTFVAATAAGDDFPNDGKTIFVIKNGGGSPITATFADTGSSSPAEANSFDADVDVIVTNAEEEWIGPFDKRRFTDSVAVTYTADTSVTVAAVRVDPA